MKKHRIRILLEIDGVPTPISFPASGAGGTEPGEPTEDPQLTYHLNNVDDAVRAALYAAGFELEDY